jgi:energy-coupling factor transport system permease protein
VIVVAFRVLMQVIFVAPIGSTLLLDLPGITLPSWLAGIRLGGSIMLEPLLNALYEGLRLAAILVAVGAASSLASPSRLLKSVPAAIYEIGVSVVVATTFLPQLASDVARIRGNRRLRGRKDSGLRGVGGTVMPVLHGAMDRSITLAAAMDSRGYGRTDRVTKAARRLTAGTLVAAVILATIGTYGLLGTGSATVWGPGLLLAGLTCAAISVALAGRRSVRTRYRPNAWKTPDIATACAGAATAIMFLAAGIFDATGMNPSTAPAQWPSVPLLALLGLLAAVLPAFVSPPPPRDAGDHA